MTDAPAYLTDTHPLIFLWEDSPELGPAARVAFARAATGKAVIHVPTICLVEIRYKEDKGNDPAFPPGITDRARAFVETAPGFQWTSLDLEAAHEVRSVARSAVPDMPDRIIAATARARGVPLITKDAKIVAWGGVEVVW